MNRGGFTSEGRLLAGALTAFVAVVLLASIDLATDAREGTTLGHVMVEGCVVLVGLAGAGAITRRLARTIRRTREAEAEAQSLAKRLAQTAEAAERWRTEARDLVAGLGAAIDRQFDRWELSPAEKEVGLLLLKGLSHREIAGARSITEATARQQSRAVYRKAGLSGRADLAAFFLEDLMLPSDQRG
ncbi:LuxR family transcriptional regulator [bacterium]|nr:LuxR family transcriptional regulator [bacterium]